MEMEFLAENADSVFELLIIIGGGLASLKAVLRRLDKLEEKVEKHNNFDSRLARVETKVEAIQDGLD